jgi:phenylpyruvate tautomerase PptA (4-oxalocrotonate tautomerase family)
MPHVIVKLWPGKSEEQKTRLAEAIAKNVMDILHYGDESVSVAMEEVKSRDWVEKVYKPDIQNKWDALYKKPGARTAWHTHPLGQTLIVTAGCGWVQRQGGPIEEIHPGDVVWFSPGEKHWHGATPTTGMTHIAIQEKKDGKVVEWMEHVSDEQYQKQ